MSAKDFSCTKPMGFYEAAIGQRNQNYYLSKFENFDAQGPGLHASWNWAAFFFTGFWALYRKMYGWFFAWWLIATVGTIFGKVPNSQIQSVVSLITLASWLGFSVCANSLYHHKIKKRIAATQKTNSVVPRVEKLSASGNAYAPTTPPANNAYAAALAEMEEGRLDKGVWARSFAESGGDESKAKAAYIKARAETFQNADVAVGAIKHDTASHPTAKSISSGVNMWVPIGLGGLTLLGVVAAITLPAYQDYTKRQTVAESSAPNAQQGQGRLPAPTAQVQSSFDGLIGKWKCQNQTRTDDRTREIEYRSDGKYFYNDSGIGATWKVLPGDILEMSDKGFSSSEKIIWKSSTEMLLRSTIVLDGEKSNTNDTMDCVKVASGEYTKRNAVVASQITSKPGFDTEGWTQDSTGSSEVGPWLDYSPSGTRYCRYADRTIQRLYPPGVRPDAEKANPFCVGDSTQFPDELR